MTQAHVFVTFYDIFVSPLGWLTKTLHSFAPPPHFRSQCCLPPVEKFARPDLSSHYELHEVCCTILWLQRELEAEATFDRWYSSVAAD